MKTKEQAYLDLSLNLPIELKAVQDRLLRAYNEVLDPNQYTLTALGEGVYKAVKLSTSFLEDNSRRYTVTSQQCSCPDWEGTYAHLCKHRLAVLILEEMQS